jgi:hydrogenase-4 component B
MALVVVAANMITFMLAWEIMSLSSFFLVVYDYETPENSKAGYLYFIFSQVGPCSFLRPSGSSMAMTAVSVLMPPACRNAAKILVFCAGVYRLRLQGRCLSLSCLAAPRPPGGPQHISALMSGVMIKTGIYGILSMYSILNLAYAGHWEPSF